MSSENETVDEIVGEMRKMPQGWIVDANANFVFVRYADRIEAAHRREVAELREFLKEAIEEKCGHCKAEWYGQCVTKDGGDCELIAKWRKALEGAEDDNA